MAWPLPVQVQYTPTSTQWGTLSTVHLMVISQVYYFLVCFFPGSKTIRVTDLPRNLSLGQEPSRGAHFLFTFQIPLVAMETEHRHPTQQLVVNIRTRRPSLGPSHGFTRTRACTHTHTHTHELGSFQSPMSSYQFSQENPLSFPQEIYINLGETWLPGYAL